jgi:branched-chain amino acid transport system substrate-binding protein
VTTHRLIAAGVSGVVVASLALTGCGSRTDAGGAASGNKIAKIAVIAPLTGDLSVMGLGIKNSVDLAIKQANTANTIPGWTLQLEAQDDQATPDVGANAATKVAADKSVVAVVGTLNSGVAQSVQPILNTANITMVSPANTNPALTIGADAANPKRTYPNYFRVCTTDAIQGPFAAQYVYNTLGLKSVAVVNDKKPYGQGLAEAFAKEFAKLGGTVVDSETVNKDDKDFSAVISNMKSKSPQLVYFGTEFQLAGPMSSQMKAAGLNVPLMGGDGIYDDKYIALAGAKSDSDMATSVGAPIETLDSGKSFLAAYKAGGYSDGYSAYGAYAYDAANAIIAALKTSLPSAADGASARQATVTAMGSVSFDGATGKVGFDKYGDAVSKTLTVYAVTGGKWVPKSTGTLK